MKLLIPILTLSAFLWLAHYSYVKTRPYDVAGLNDLSWRASHAQETALMDVYGLTDEDIAKPVILLNKEKLTMQITLEHKTVFGNDRYYPTCDVSKVICALGDFKSFTSAQVELMKHHKWEIKAKQVDI